MLMHLTSQDRAILVLNCVVHIVRAIGDQRKVGEGFMEEVALRCSLRVGQTVCS